MKNWSIKNKLIFLSLILLGLLIISGAIQDYGNKKVFEQIENISQVQMKALFNATLADMEHEGLRGIAYRAISINEKSDPKEKKEVAEDFKGASDNIVKYLEIVHQLKIHDETRVLLGESQSSVKEYVAAAEEIVGLAVAGRKEAAQEKISVFDKSFFALAEKLDAFGKMIEKDADESRIYAAEVATKYKLIGIIVVFFGTIVGGLLSLWIISDLLKTLNNVVGRLKQSSGEVSSASSKSASSATELSEASTEQAASLQETMASAEQISAMVNQNAESASKAQLAVEKNKVATEDGSNSVNDMMTAINEIKGTNDQILTQMESSNKEFAEIVKIITEIGEKTKVIDDIVFQTKLLSFNASVEAARAGEHGKGFAVVAEEVGNLAQMSGNAAKQITDLLSGSIKKVNDIVTQTSSRVDQLVEVGKDKISMGLATATKCRDALNIISENANTVTAMVTEIAHASKEQSQGVQEINKAISQLDQVTQQNAAVAQESSIQAEHLKSESVSLTAAVTTLTELIGVEKIQGRHHVSEDYSKEFKKAKVSNSVRSAFISEVPKNLATPTTKVRTVSNTTFVSAKNASPKKITLDQRNNMAKVSKEAVGSTELAVPSSSDKNFESF